MSADDGDDEKDLGENPKKDEQPGSETEGKTKSGNYIVGRGKTPPEHRFKSGTSGNPRGRPKGSKNLETEMREELSQRVPVSENGHKRAMTKLRVMIKALVAKAMHGDVRAFDQLMKYEDRFASRKASESGSTPLPEEDEAIISAYFLKLQKAAEEKAPDKTAGQINIHEQEIGAPEDKKSEDGPEKENENESDQ